jgi:exodeoxyribonuclease X
MTTPAPAALANQRLVVVDVEGNGQNPPEIVEIAVLPIDESVAFSDIQSWLVRPAGPITAIVTGKVHGISNLDVAMCPAWAEVAPEVDWALGDRVLVAHGAHVERRVLGEHLPDWRPRLVLDTLRLARHVWPSLTSYSLPMLTKHADLDMSAVTDLQPHRAGYDTWCAWQLLRALLDSSDLDWDGLVAVASLPGPTNTAKAVEATEPEGGLW